MSENTPSLDKDELLVQMDDEPVVEKTLNLNKYELRCFVEIHFDHNLPFCLFIHQNYKRGQHNVKQRPVTVTYPPRHEMLVSWAESYAKHSASSYVE